MHFRTREQNTEGGGRESRKRGGRRLGTTRRENKMSDRTWHGGQGEVSREEGGHRRRGANRQGYLNQLHLHSDLVLPLPPVTFILTFNHPAPRVYLIYLFLIQIMPGRKMSDSSTRLTTVQLL